MNICLRDMTQNEFKRYSLFSFQNFVKERAKSSGCSIEEILRIETQPKEITSNDIWQVICKANDSIGYIWIRLFPEKKEAFGYEIYLKERFRSQGVGRKVIEQCRSFLKEREVKRIEICVFKDNLIARNLYASMGFKEKLYHEIKQQYRLELKL